MFRRRSGLKKFIIVVACLYIFYSINVVFNLPGLSNLRNIWISTAMTTQTHKWLATAFFPDYLIEWVMNGAKKLSTDQKSSAKLKRASNIIKELSNGAKIGEPDINGNKILEINKKQRIIIIEVKTSFYVGRLLFCDDPNRVKVVNSKYSGKGEFIKEYCEDNDAIAGMNANGFIDPGGGGNGGSINGLSIASGKSVGFLSLSKNSGGFKKNSNVLDVGKFTNIDVNKYRDFFQWGPTLILDNEIVNKKGDFLGLQPRSAIAQLNSGAIIFATVDGRQPGYSLGIQTNELAKLLYEYGAVNALLLDGGSSSIMNYDGKNLGITSSPLKATGRALPNAIIIKRRN